MYQEQINKLGFVINNWETIQLLTYLAKQEFKEEFNCHLNEGLGLCRNCGLEDLDGDIITPIFESFNGFSGDSDYPLGEEEFNEFNNFTDNPKRLELAIHCLNKLKELQDKL